MASEPIYGILPRDWEMVSLSELIDKGEAHLQTGPFGTALHASAYRPTGTPVVAVLNIGDNRLIKHDDLPRVDEATAKRLDRYRLKENDILFGRKGAVDRRALIHSEEEGWLQGSDCIRLRFYGDDISPRFVSYVLGSSAYRDWVIQHAHGATMPSLNQEILGLMPIPFAPISEQHAVAYILGTLDDKIELNRNMNRTLEDMARALFKAWFVDFEPVRAKAEGRDTGLPSHLAELFPARLVDSELGEVPEGWHVRTISDLADVVGGSTPSTKEPLYWDEGVYHWTTPKDLSTLIVPVLLNTERKITEEGLRQISSGLLPIGTVLLSSRAPIGYLAIAEVPTAINQGFIALLPTEGVSNLFLLYWAEVAHDEIVSRANGSTFLEISKSNFRPISVIQPSGPVMSAFDTQVRPLYERIVLNEKGSRTLATIRDAMLPKLIGGEIRMKDAEKFIARIA